MEDLFINLPRFKKDAYRIHSLIPEWAQAYGVDDRAIIRQLAYAHGWIESNPRKAPRRDVVRFLFNWMRKAKECGNLRVPEAIRTREPDRESDLTYEEMVAIRKANMGGPSVSPTG